MISDEEKRVKIKQIIQSNNRFVISVIGPHAGCSVDEIFKTKSEDIKNIGYTFWLCKSWLANEETLKNFFKSNTRVQDTNNNLELNENLENLYMLFVKTTSNGYGKDTKTTTKAKYYKNPNDKLDEKRPMPTGMNNVTGNLGKKGAISFIFENIYVDELCSNSIDLNSMKCITDNSKYNGEVPKSGMGRSTFCVEKNGVNEGTKDIRKVLAIAELKNPYFVTVYPEYEEKVKVKVMKKTNKN